ncbi:MAG: RNA methyltransferase [Thermoanaerobaculaceae bacterium]|jgi:TrmH family RNA methyltransferase
MHDAQTLPILGRHNPRLLRLRRIAQRQEPDLTVADGLKLAADLAVAGVPIVELFTVPERLDEVRKSPELRTVCEAGRAYLIDPATASNLAPTRQTQGVLAVVTIPLVHLGAEGVVIYLDGVQDPGNVGSVIRCAAAFGAAGVACSPECADPFSPRALRASAGHALLLPVEAGAAFEPLAEKTRLAGGEVAGTAGHGGVPLARWRPRLPLLLALGNEGQGLSEEIRAACKRHVTVPLTGGVDSLNVAVTAGVILGSLAGVAGSPILDFRGHEGRPR